MSLVLSVPDASSDVLLCDCEKREAEVRSEGSELSFETAYQDMIRDGIVRMHRIVRHAPLTKSLELIDMTLYSVSFFLFLLGEKKVCFLASISSRGCLLF